MIKAGFMKVRVIVLIRAKSSNQRLAKH